VPQFMMLRMIEFQIVLVNAFKVFLVPMSSLYLLFLSLSLQVCVLGLHLAKELCEVDEDGDYWLQITRKVPVLPTIFTALEISLRVKQNLHFTEASLHLLLTLARTQQVRDVEK